MCTVSLCTQRCKRNSMRDVHSFQQPMLEQLYIYMQKMNFSPCITLFIKLTEMNYKTKVVEDDTGENLCGLWPHRDFIDNTTQSVIQKGN